MNEMMKLKLSPELVDQILGQTIPDPVPVIIQVKGESKETDRLCDADRQMIETVGGKVLDDLWIIKGFSAEVPAKALEMIVLSPRVTHIHSNNDVSGVD